MKGMKKVLVACFLGALGGFGVQANAEDTEFDYLAEQSLEDLLNLEVVSTSKMRH